MVQYLHATFSHYTYLHSSLQRTHPIESNWQFLYSPNNCNLEKNVSQLLVPWLLYRLNGIGVKYSNIGILVAELYRIILKLLPLRKRYYP